MRWLKLSALCVAAPCVLLACAGTASAQVPMPGYTFAEVEGADGKPLSDATTVVYDESGEEVRSSVTNAEGRSPLMVNDYQQKRFIVRVIKRGYQTYEAVFNTLGRPYVNTGIKIKLTPLPARKPKAVDRRRAASAPFKRDAPSGLLRGPPT